MKLTPQGLELVKENSKLRKRMRNATSVNDSTISVWCSNNSPRLVDLIPLILIQEEYKSLNVFDLLEFDNDEKGIVKRDFFEYLRVVLMPMNEGKALVDNDNF